MQLWVARISGVWYNHVVKNVKTLGKRGKTATIKFGNHLIFDGYNCDYRRLDNETYIIKVLNNLVRIAKMKKISDPVIVKADGNETLGGKDPGGYSAFVLIQESHISIHTFTRRKFLTVDVYTCKEFEAQPVIEYLRDAFKVKDSDILKIDRGLKYPAKNLI